MALAGGFYPGDPVVLKSGVPCEVVGQACRAACRSISVAVRFEDGRVADVRVAELELLVDAEAEASPAARSPEAGEDAYEGSPTKTETPRYMDEEEASRVVDETYGISRGLVEDRYVRKLTPRRAKSVAETVETSLREKMRMNFSDLRTAFRAFDALDHGYVSLDEFIQTAARLLNTPVSDELVELARRFDLNGDGFISFSEFSAQLDGRRRGNTSGQERKHSAAECIGPVDLGVQALKIAVDRKYPTLRDAFLFYCSDPKGSGLTPDDFRRALELNDVALEPDDAEAAYRRFDKAGNGRISYHDFTKVLSKTFQFGTHLGRQAFRNEDDKDRKAKKVSVVEPEEAQAKKASRQPEIDAEDLLRPEGETLRRAFLGLDRRSSGKVLKRDLGMATARILGHRRWSRRAIDAVLQYLGLTEDGMITEKDLVARLSDAGCWSKDQALLDDQRAARPLGGELESGYGLGNRSLPDRYRKQLSPRNKAADKLAEAEELLLEKIQANYADMRLAFRSFDRSENGHISYEDFLEAARHLLYPVDYGSEVLTALASKFDFNQDGVICFPEFSAYVHGVDPTPSATTSPKANGSHDRRIEFHNHEDEERIDESDLLVDQLKSALYRRFQSVREAFLALAGTGRKVSLTREDFHRGLAQLGYDLSREQIDQAWRHFDQAGNGRVTYPAFSSVMEEHVQYSSHLDRQFFRNN
eukprot:TRINITY_DN52084_c0_g1_i1.p1 TRINITY_DN52084_c0_g1~~TRINITY_DN52084_c0_g1_i1.p1  ORF type:complete len:701 (-),score=185.62 TRINITY_DN52084_c0_g1_i1:126-2228(-)